MSDKIIVLGAGLVGSAIAADYKRSGYHVTAMDIDGKALGELEQHYGIEVLQSDFTVRGNLEKAVSDKDLVIGAAPGAFGYKLMKEVILCGKNMVDISFCPEDYLELDSLAKEKGVTVVADMGVAPGMCNAILGYHDAHMEVKRYKCIVGGLPDKRIWPLEYKSAWSPIDCIEEYTRPARLMQNGRVVTKPALSDIEMVEFEETGTLEEWNSDGLRSLLTTMRHVPDMVEKTLRYPGTTSYIRVLRDLGFFSYDEVEVKGKKIRPIDLTANLLFPQWKFEKGESEFTIMRVVVTGEEAGEASAYQYDLFDKYDVPTGTSSMARTTGYTCAGAGEMILKGKLNSKGVLAPEMVGSDAGRFNYLLHYLEERGVNYRRARSQALSEA
ncbi:MAG: saccharopine dehydrogenase NADP-binding domain-containing protein [Bacteroidales bacterium]|nr:saccharopine dehydrogenase NADP-binding domain-containing protein [Bacteroidales bacterium]